MSDVPGQSQAIVEEKLRTWAKGDLPAMAGVEFLIMSGAIERHAELGGIIVVDEHGAWIDPVNLHTAVATNKFGYMSAGERSTWRLIDSILTGQLNDTYWSLDPTRKAAFITALASAQ